MESIVKSKSTGIYHIGAFLMVSAWGISFISTKELLNNGLNPTEIYLLRFTLAYLLLIGVTYKQIFARSLKDEFLFFICGLCGGSIYFITENTAIGYTLVSNVSLIVTTTPLLTALLMGLIYKNERISAVAVTGSVIAFIGVGFVIFNSSFKLAVNPLGDILSLCAALSWAIYAVVLKSLNGKYDTLFMTRKTFFYGILTCIPFFLLQPSAITADVLLRPAVIYNLLFLGIFASMLCYILWNVTVKNLGAIRVSNYLYFTPITTLLISAVYLGDRITIIGIAGFALILGGVILSEKLRRQL